MEKHTLKCFTANTSREKNVSLHKQITSHVPLSRRRERDNTDSNLKLELKLEDPLARAGQRTGGGKPPASKNGRQA